MVDAPTWWEGFMDLVEDKVTEHPKKGYIYHEINGKIILTPQFSLRKIGAFQSKGRAAL